MRVAVVGKGGAGKSVIAGTIARVAARRGERVLALDSDLMPGLAFSLGAEQPPLAPLSQATERDERGRWRLRKGIGPVRAVQRFSTPAPDGIRLLQSGKVEHANGVDPLNGSLNAFYQVVQRLDEAPSLRDWTLVADLPAGPRQTAYRWAPYADTFVVVVEASWKSVLTARRLIRIVRETGARRVLPVANKVAGRGDREAIERLLGEAPFLTVPADEAVATADRRGLAPIDHAPRSAAVQAIERLVDALEAE